MALTFGYLKCLQFFVKNLLYLIFFLGLVSSVSLEPTIFFICCSTLWNSVGEISPSCNSCEIILVMLSNLLWGSSLIAWCFPCFTVNILKYFCVMAVAREISRLVPLKAIPTGNRTPLANAAILIPPVITVDVVRPVSTIPMIVLNRFVFLTICSRTSISLRKYASISLNLFSRYDCGSCGAVGFKSGYILVHCRYVHSLFNIRR